MDKAASQATHSKNAVEIWQLNRPGRPYRELSRQHVVVNESVWGGDALQRNIARNVWLAKGDAAIILSSEQRRQTRQTDQHTYQTIIREAHIAIVSYR